MIAKVIAAFIAVVVGGWMMFDGIYVLATGKYFGPEKPGPWSGIVAAVGIDPFKFGIPFVILGALWLLFMVAMLLNQPWGWPGALITAILTLWYLPIGTALSLIYIVLLLLYRTRFLP